jgi:hypothetical protein
MNPDKASWSPSNLRTPTISGARGGLKFAFFAEKRRLLVENDGNLQLFDSGAHQIHEVGEMVDHPTLEFISQSGRHPIGALKLIN